MDRLELMRKGFPKNTPNIQALVDSVGTPANSDDRDVAKRFAGIAYRALDKQSKGQTLDAVEAQALEDLRTIQAEIRGDLD